eukprot:CAMPEP_0119556536 /NCGR_PEP_ID=MMETSP1352-20130426/8448_1 /TAXON_ID=265584 /ORGANISM="Stauroneis constricta, Strain CCMP1120" /LENGTH=489 /DNA_ID=CAMNT_0007603505 /DNA_START=32 /DNA_END=1501 /DNA_ORIENTATION=-
MKKRSFLEADYSSGSDTNSNSGCESSSSSPAACFSGPFSAAFSTQPRSRRKAKKNATDDGELLLAKEMGELSMQERETVYEDIHGVSKEASESAELVKSCLEQFEAELVGIRKKHGYDKAIFVNPKYVRDERFRLMFLRADNFNVAKSARRIINHFDEKYKLFGYNRIGKRIRWDDLDEDDRHSVNTGATQLFTKDKTGRGLFFNVYAHRRDKSAIHHLRAMWYTFMTAVQDDQQIQRKGIVLVAYTIGATIKEFFRNTGMTRQQDFEKVLPFRVCAIHVCFGDRRFQPIISTFMAAHPQSNRLRVKIHLGSHMECQYFLNSFGIHESMLPFGSDGNLKPGLFEERLKKVRDQEEQEDAAHRKLLNGVIPYPTISDVLCGRGSPFQKFPGNVQLQQMVEEYKPKHDLATSRMAKTAISVQVIDELKRKGARFLKRHESNLGWYEVAPEIAREKVAMSFRNLSRKTRVSNTSVGSNKTTSSSSSSGAESS